MLVNTITRHSIRNYGSALQAAATRELLTSAGLTPRFVDYRQPGIADTGWSYARNSRAREKGFVAMAAYATMRSVNARRVGGVFEGFIRQNLPLTEQRYSSYDQLARSREFSTDDLYCVGSDQVWNLRYNGDNRPYYLDFAPKGARKFSLASSLGLDQMPEGEEERFVAALSSYSGVSVREGALVSYLSSLGISAEHHVDPTLAVDLDFWERFAGTSSPKITQPYILVYQLNSGPDFEETVRQVVRETGLSALRIEYRRTRRSRPAAPVVAPSLEEFVRLFRDSEVVVTDSFHGTVFSTIFGRSQVVVPPPKYAERIYSLLRLSRREAALARTPDEAVDALVATPNLAQTRDLLRVEHHKVVAYLDRVRA